MASHGSFRFKLIWSCVFSRGSRKELVVRLRGACGTRAAGTRYAGPTSGLSQTRPLRRVKIAPAKSLFEHTFGHQRAPKAPQKRLQGLLGGAGMQSAMPDVHFGENSAAHSLY